ncbi:MAG: hypothetical protein ACUVT3_11370 [Ignavibacterium sp.]
MKLTDILISAIILFSFLSFAALSFQSFSIYQPTITENTSFQDYSYFANETITPLTSGILSYANTSYGGSDLFMQLQIAFGLGTYIIFGMLKTIVFTIISFPMLMISLFSDLVLKTNNEFLTQIFGILSATIFTIITLYIIGLIVRIYTQRGEI